MLPEVGGLAAAPDEAVVRRTLGALSTLLPVGIFAADSNGRLWYANQRICEAMDVGPYDQAASTLSIHPEDLLLITETWRRSVQRADRPTVMRIIAPDRPAKSFAGQGGPSRRPEREGAEFRRLRDRIHGRGRRGRVGFASARLLESLLDKSREIVTVVDDRGRWRYSSAEAWRLLGYGPTSIR